MPKSVKSSAIRYYYCYYIVAYINKLYVYMLPLDFSLIYVREHFPRIFYNIYKRGQLD